MELQVGQLVECQTVNPSYTKLWVGKIVGFGRHPRRGEAWKDVVHAIIKVSFGLKGHQYIQEIEYIPVEELYQDKDEYIYPIKIEKRNGKLHAIRLIE